MLCFAALKTHEGINGMDLKSLFKRKAVADKVSAPKVADKPQKPTKLRKVRTLSKRAQWSALAFVLLLVGGGAAFYLFYWPDFSKEYADVLPSFMTEDEVKAPPPAPTPNPAPHKVEASSVAPTIGQVTASAVSSVNPVSEVSGVSAPMAAISSVNIANAAASDVPTSSAVTPSVPLDAISASSDVAAPPPVPAPHKVVTRPKNRDMRHCLDLKTEAEIMRCVYPKH